MNEPCNKVKYGTKKAAEEDLKRIKNSSKKEILPIRAYECKICNCWHLTSKPLITEKKETVTGNSECNSECNPEAKKYVCDALMLCNSISMQLITMQNKIERLTYQLNESKKQL